MYKVGLMTWYKYFNYGTSLQVVGLNNLIKELGYDCKLINYKPKGSVLDKIEKKELIKKVQNKFHYRSHYNCDKRSELFSDFLDVFLDETKSCNSFSELRLLNEEFDAFVCGSDQIWSPICFDTHYYLDFADNNKIISYAPSIGSSTVKNEMIRDSISNLVKRFKYLSIREEKGKELLKEIADVDAKLVLDPTLLHDSNYWSSIENKDIANYIGKKYVVCYYLGESNHYLKHIEKYCNENDLLLLNIPVFNETKINKYNTPFEVGPKEFISLIHNAELILTDSYHGTLFSILFNKEFFTFKRFKDGCKDDQNSRIYNILKKTKLESRLLSNSTLIQNVKIDYNPVNEIIENLRKESISYLENAIKSVCNFSASKYDLTMTNLCCGCGACAMACPVNAISLSKNDNGFYDYSVDAEKCIHCNKCIKVCPMINVNSKYLDKSNALFSFKANEDSTLQMSSSGGFSHVLSKFFLERGYAIVGCTYNNCNKRAEHIVVTDENELHRIQGSKYIQSFTQDALKEIIESRKIDKFVVIGTPCQISGIKNAIELRHDINDVVYVDLICHGVPSYYAWDKYLSEIEKNNNIDVESEQVIIRKKNNSWRKMHIEIKDKNHCYTNDEFNDSFYKMFKSMYCYNKSCYECPYRERSSADIRIGDYWGNKFVDDNTGVSMVIAVNDKGNNIINNFNENNLAKIKKQPLSDYWLIQGPYNPRKPLFYDDLINDLKNPNKSFKSIINDYMFYNEFIYKVRRIKKLFK